MGLSDLLRGGVLDMNLKYGEKKRFVLLSIFVCGSDVLLRFLMDDKVRRERNFWGNEGNSVCCFEPKVYEG